MTHGGVVVGALVHRVDRANDLAVADAVVLVEVDLRMLLALAEGGEGDEELLFWLLVLGRLGGQEREDNDQENGRKRKALHLVLLSVVVGKPSPDARDKGDKTTGRRRKRHQKRNQSPHAVGMRRREQHRTDGQVQ